MTMFQMHSLTVAKRIYNGVRVECIRAPEIRWILVTIRDILVLLELVAWQTHQHVFYYFPFIVAP